MNRRLAGHGWPTVRRLQISSTLLVLYENSSMYYEYVLLPVVQAHETDIVRNEIQEMTQCYAGEG
jgi:hypothetical protein